jgi:hypothetical protein
MTPSRVVSAAPTMAIDFGCIAVTSARAEEGQDQPGRDEAARMRCEENCSTFGNAYREGGLDRIRECEARCRR